MKKIKALKQKLELMAEIHELGMVKGPLKYVPDFYYDERAVHGNCLIDGEYAREELTTDIERGVIVPWYSLEQILNLNLAYRDVHLCQLRCLKNELTNDFLRGRT